MANIVKFGIIGTNFISDRFVDAVRQTQTAEVVAVLSRTREAGEAFAQKHRIPKAYTAEADFLADSEIDAVYAAVPNSLHYDYTLHAINSGKHVLCEKPMSLCAAEFDRLAVHAKSHGKLLLEAMRPAFDPYYQALKAEMEKLGKIRYAHLDFCQYSSRYDAFLRGDVQRAFTPAYGNAAVMDIGIYPIFVAMMLFGLPNSVSPNSVFLANGFEGMGQVTLAYDEMLCNVTYSKITQSPTPSQITGEKGSLLIDKLTEPAQMIYRTKEGKEEKMPLTPLSNNMIYEVETFCQLVLTGEITHPAMDWSRMAIRVVDGIRQKENIRFSGEDELFRC